ncbi:MAG: hypothetical protein IPK60_06070 [Sandaracinaceae bacterium]|nr:hypothetical protein [Sandaracinaceae bacterium]
MQRGDCRIWKAIKLEIATCSSHKPMGAGWEGWAKKKPAAAGTPRRMRDDYNDEPIKIPLPQEIDIDMDQNEFRRVLREVIREELGAGETVLGERWRGGELVLAPGKKDTQEKRIPIDAFFHKIVMLRDKLRVLEQKLNGSALADDDKVQMQQYITACYGTLTTFNVLFRDKEDNFQGQKGGKD